jgi:hypothetical protein
MDSIGWQEGLAGSCRELRGLINFATRPGAGCLLGGRACDYISMLPLLFGS